MSESLVSVVRRKEVGLEIGVAVTRKQDWGRSSKRFLE